MHRPLRLIRNIETARLFDIFLLSSIVTILLTRLFLQLTGYPQIGGSAGLHIAHLLPGGLLMLIAILITLGAINRMARILAAYLGGIGFGLFWDELGKFITKDNNYFFRPTVGILYVSFITLYLIMRYVIRRSYHPVDYLANALDIAIEGAINALDPREYRRAKDLLQLSDHSHPMYNAAVELLEKAKPSKKHRSFIVNRLAAKIYEPFEQFVRQPWFLRALLKLFYLYGLGILITLLLLVFGGSDEPFFQLIANPSADSNVIAMLSSAMSAFYVIWGTWLLQLGQVQKALRRLEIAVLINIFITQVFWFFIYQWAAVMPLLATLLILVIIRILSTAYSASSLMEQ